MNFDFLSAGCEVKHIAHFMVLAQDCLDELYPALEGKKDKIGSIYSLVRISERIALELIEQLEAWNMEVAKGRIGRDG